MCPEGAYAHTPAHIINAHSTSHLCNTLTLNINNILLESVLICFIFVTVSKRCFRKMLFIFHCVSVQIFRLFSMSLSFSMNSLNEWQRRRRRYGGRRMREEESGGFCQPEINKAGTLLLLRLLCLSFSCPPCPPSLVFFSTRIHPWPRYVFPFSLFLFQFLRYHACTARNSLCFCSCRDSVR